MNEIVETRQRVVMKQSTCIEMYVYNLCIGESTRANERTVNLKQEKRKRKRRRREKPVEDKLKGTVELNCCCLTTTTRKMHDVSMNWPRPAIAMSRIPDVACRARLADRIAEIDRRRCRRVELD